jgi:hypothetical protein
MSILDDFPEYSNDNPLVVQLQRNNITVIPDSKFAAWFVWISFHRFHKAWDVDMVEFLNTAKVLDEFEK